MHALWLEPQNPFGIIELVWKQDPTLPRFLIRVRTRPTALQSLASESWAETDQEESLHALQLRLLFLQYITLKHLFSPLIKFEWHQKTHEADRKFQFTTNELYFLKSSTEHLLLKNAHREKVKLQRKWSRIRHILSWCRQDLWFLETVLRGHTGTAGS